MAQDTTALSVHNAPAPVSVMFSELDSAICSGASITLTMDEPALDASSTWTTSTTPGRLWEAMSFTLWNAFTLVDETEDLTLATSQGWSSDFDPVTVS